MRLPPYLLFIASATVFLVSADAFAQNTHIDARPMATADGTDKEAVMERRDDAMPERMEHMKERYKTMPPEQKQKIREHRRERRQ